MKDLFGNDDRPEPKKEEKPKPVTKKDTNHSTFDLSKVRPYRILRLETKPHITWVINTEEKQ